jgi:4'-phosphopantetheinyl transferase
VWSFALDAAVDESVLGADERARARRFRFARDRERFVRRRVLLRRVLARYAGCAPADVAYAVNDYGKPTLVGHPELHFSASASGGRAEIAVGPAELGIDVEQVVPSDDLDAVAERFFAPDERRQLRGVEDFFRCWSRKEAYVKAVGQGLSFPLASFAVEVADVPHPRLLRSARLPDDPATATIVDLSRPGFMAALVVRSPLPDPHSQHRVSSEPERRNIDDL